jgi:hypothetical protein
MSFAVLDEMHEAQCRLPIFIYTPVLDHVGSKQTQYLPNFVQPRSATVVSQLLLDSINLPTPCQDNHEVLDCCSVLRRYLPCLRYCM